MDYRAAGVLANTEEEKARLCASMQSLCPPPPFLLPPPVCLLSLSSLVTAKVFFVEGSQSHLDSAMINFASHRVFAGDVFVYMVVVTLSPL